MLTRKELHSKYSEDVRYISPAAIHYSTSEIPEHFWCAGTVEDILGDYVKHMLNPPSGRCYTVIKSTDGVFRCAFEPEVEELEWLTIEYSLRMAIINAGGKHRTAKFVI